MTPDGEPEEPRGDEMGRVAAWRTLRLVDVGVELADAETLALTRLDLAEFAQAFQALLARGCAPHAAAAILWPLDG